MNHMSIALTIVQLIACVALVGIVLFQTGKSSGLSGAIAGSSETFMNRSKNATLDAKLAKATKWVAIIFVVLTLILNLIK